MRIKWTNCGKYWFGRGNVEKINKQSFIVILSEDVGNEHDPAEGYYYAGLDIKVPRLANGSGMKLWSVNNRLEPVGGYTA